MTREEFVRRYKAHPDIARDRKIIADQLRAAHRHNPAVARLMNKRLRQAEKEFAESLVSQGFILVLP